MKVLMLTPYLPFPPSSGGQIRSFNLIKYLSRKHEITLFSLIKDEKEVAYTKELKKYCQKIQLFKRSKNPWTPRNILRTALGTYPFLVIRNLVPEEKHSVEKELNEVQYDLIHAETFYVMPHIPETKVPVLLVDQTIEYLVYKHFVNEQAPFFLRGLLALDVKKLKNWEKIYWEKAKKVVAVSEADKKKMLKLTPKLDVEVVPNGVDLDFFKVKTNWERDKPEILFVANFKWLQNKEAAEFLLNKVFPEVVKRNEKARLAIVGQHVPEKIRQRQSRAIKIKDVAEDDEESIKNAYYQASVFVSPLKGPGGTRLKHFAAMATKLPLVTTSVGAEGLGGKNGKDLIIRDDLSKMADAVCDLIENPDKTKAMVENARGLVVKYYSWERMANLLDKIYIETAHD